MNLMLVIKFCCLDPVSGFLQANYFPGGKGHHIEEVYRSGAIKINNFEGTKPQVVNGQRLKHYIAGDPVNVDVNMIYTTTHEEHVAALFQTPAEAE